MPTSLTPEQVIPEGAAYPGAPTDLVLFRVH